MNYFLDLGQSYQLPRRGTKEYSDLQNRISRNLKELTSLKDVPGFEEVIITKFKRYVN